MAYIIQTRNGPNHDDFDKKTDFYSKPMGKEQFLKPVIILTDRYTISAGEIILLYMKTFAHVTQIGDSTAGDFSNISGRRFLPNGWTYQHSPQLYLYPDGSSPNGVGHIPDVYSKNAKKDIEAENDLVFERAVQYLFDEYGIE